jgi:hypothetical protein
MSLRQELKNWNGNKMNKMTRYYTCPIKSLYMMEEFGVKFTNSHQIIESVENIWKFGSKENYVNFYVAKESEYIFEPKKGDYAKVGNWGLWCLTEDIIKKEFDDITLIMRDNKQFFMPEVEK